MPQVLQEVDLATLNSEVDALITSARNEFAADFLNPVVQQRLKALLDLQSILQRQQLSQEQLRIVHDQVSALEVSSKPALPTAQTIAPSVRAMSTPPMVGAPPPVQPLQNLFNPGMLAGLIKATANRQQPTPAAQVASIAPQLPMSTSKSQTPAAENLLGALRARGLLPFASAASAPSPSSAFPLIVPGQPQYAPPTSAPQPSGGPSIPMNVQMNTAAIKM